MKVYLSGRMSGLSPETWRWRFAQWQVLLESEGHEVVNPARIWVARCMWLYRVLAGITSERTAYRLVLRYDLWLLHGCTHIFMIGKDWRLSRGARLESRKAREFGVLDFHAADAVGMVAPAADAVGMVASPSADATGMGQGGKPLEWKRGIRKGFMMNLQGIIDMMWPDDEDGRNGCIMTGLYAASLVAFFAACLFLSGCSPRVIERTIVKTDTVRMNHTAMDSIYVIDSVFVHEWHEGDTVRIETTRWRDRWRELVVHDSVYVAKTDTLRVVSAGKPQSTCPTGWQWFQIWVGRIALVALAFVLTFKIIKRWL